MENEIAMLEEKVNIMEKDIESMVLDNVEQFE
jgi:hypothetical protein